MMNILKIAIPCILLTGSVSAQYIDNQRDSVQQNANFNISGQGRAGNMLVVQTTGGAGNVYYGLQQTPGRLRWGIGTFTVENGTDSYGSNFSIYAYDNNGGYRGQYFTINRTTGGVGIGTSDTKGYRLAVNGDAMFTRIKVKAYANWPDFVFEPEYKLPSLQEVETYIKENKHLPDVPSAAEVAKEGLDVGEMNKILLQKIEELTLHLIELQKQVNELKDKNTK